MSSLLIRKVTILDPRSDFHQTVNDIFWDQGSIKQIGNDLPASADQIIDQPGIFISPGWTDLFADYREPGFEQKETILSGLRAAAAGGFAHVLTVPNTYPAVSTKAGVQYLLQKAKEHTVSLHPLGAISQNTEGKSLAEMWDMHAHGAMAFSDGWKPVQHAGLMLKALEYVKAFKGIIVQIPLDTALAADGLMHEGVLSTQLGMPGIPVLAETLLLHRDIELLRYTGSRIHITGISTAAGVEMIRNAKKEGLDITCSVTPYHLALTEEAIKNYDSLFKVTPVLRSEEDRQALIAGLADGTVDGIASHHRPQDEDAKNKEFAYAGEGMNLQEITYSLLLTATAGRITPERLTDALALAPARIFGYEPGILSPGYRDSLTLFTMHTSYFFGEKDLQSISKNNPYINTELRGQVIGVINQGKVHLNYKL